MSEAISTGTSLKLVVANRGDYVPGGARAQSKGKEMGETKVKRRKPLCDLSRNSTCCEEWTELSRRRPANISGGGAQCFRPLGDKINDNYNK